MSQVYEIEIKSLLGSEENANLLRTKLLESPLKFALASKHKQLNHYFQPAENYDLLAKNLSSLIPEEKRTNFEGMLSTGKNISIRTRDADGKNIFVMKASVGDDSSANGVSRLEFETPVPVKDLEELDNILLASGLAYQAKWSREREEYKSAETTVCLDKNAGYGYLAEFEKLVSDEAEKDKNKQELLGLMAEMGVNELTQDRLERMFAFYNIHWPEYYGTEKVFNIE